MVSTSGYNIKRNNKTTKAKRVQTLHPSVNYLLYLQYEFEFIG